MTSSSCFSFPDLCCGAGMLTSAALLAGGAYAAKKAADYARRVPVAGTALVTGSAGGLGLELCRALLRAGAEGLVVVDLRADAVEAAVEALRLQAVEARRHVRVHGYACNVADAEAVRRLAERVEREVGPVEVLVNNAGIVSGKPFLELSEEQIRRTLEVNTLAHFWTLRAFLPQMVARNHGAVITISSAGGIVGTSGLTDYSASKFAVYGLDEALRLDLRRRGSKVHTLCVTPFYIDTGLFEGVRTSVPLLLPILQARPVADAIVEALVARRHYLEVPRILSLAWLTKVLPTGMRDHILDALGVTSSMDDFKGRSKL